MKFFLTLVVAAFSLTVEANNCKIVGSTSANCRKCASTDDSSCPVTQSLSLGSTYSFSCRTTGSTVDGDNGWDYYPGGNCYVWEVLTDGNCNPTSLPTCSSGSTGSGNIPGPMVNDYPYKGSCGGVDPWNYYTCQCTSFVAWRINARLGISFTNRYKGALWGNADQWAGAASQTGVTVNSNPVPGSVAWLGPNSNGAGGNGHVAWVAAVGATTVTVEEFNWGNPQLAYHTRTVAKNQFQYIHIKV